MFHTFDFTAVMDALGWAVLHSFWQGLVALAVFTIVRGLNQEKSAAVRYVSGLLSLSFMLAAFVATFLISFQTVSSHIVSPHIAAFGAEPVNVNAATISANGAQSLSSPIAFILARTEFIGLVWLVGYFIFSLRAGMAWQHIRRLRRDGLSDAPQIWQNKFNTLCAHGGLKSGLKSKVRLYVSKHVGAPITFGLIKPVVLVPVWFFTGLSAAQCEAILLHEIAHIRRGDYFSNIWIVLIKAVFFYHPVVSYISKSMDADREHACDDFAVNFTKQPDTLAKALGNLRLKTASDHSVFALSANGPDTPFVNRLKRLVGVKVNRAPVHKPKAALVIAGFTALVFAGLSASQSQAHPKKDGRPSNGAELAGTCGTCETQSIVVNGEVYTSSQAEIEALNSIKTIGNGKNNTYHIINGKKYPSRYTYQLFSKDGKTYVTKTKNGRRYIEIGNNWYTVQNTARNAPTPPETPIAPKTGKWQLRPSTPKPPKAPTPVLQADASARAKVLSLKTTEKRIRKLEQKIAKLERKLASKELEIAQLDSQNDEKIMEIDREIGEKETRLEQHTTGAATLSPSEIGKLQAEIGRLQGSIGRLYGNSGAYQGEIGRLSGEIGRLQGEIGRLQSETARLDADKARKKFEAMRTELLSLLKADGYMKSERSKVVLKTTPTDIYINGKALPDTKEGQYCDILSKYIDRKGDIKTIVIKPHGFDVKIKGQNTNSHYSYTYNN